MLLMCQVVDKILRKEYTVHEREDVARPDNLATEAAATAAVHGNNWTAATLRNIVSRCGDVRENGKVEFIYQACLSVDLQVC
jgi:hypothetical protein